MKIALTKRKKKQRLKFGSKDLLWYVNHGDIGQVAVRESECDDYRNVPVV